MRAAEGSLLHSAVATAYGADFDAPAARGSSYAAYYHPWLIVPTPDRATTLAVPPGGHVAGVYARTDLQKGVWKAPAGARIERVTALSENITSSDVSLLWTAASTSSETNRFEELS